MTNAKLFLLLLGLEHLAPTLASAGQSDSGSLESTGLASSALHLSRDHIGKILFTALEDRVTLQHLHGVGDDRDDRRLSSDGKMREEDAWRRIVRHGWDWSRRGHAGSARERRTSRRHLRRDDDSAKEQDSDAKVPFVVCSASLGQSGYRRRSAIAQELDVPLEDTQAVYNTDDESCFLVPSTANAMESYHSRLVQATLDDTETPDKLSNITTSPVHFGPLLDVLKLPRGTALNVLSDDDWAPSELSAFATRTVTNEFSYENTTEEVDVNLRKWSRSFLVDLLPGAFRGEESVEDAAGGIIEYVKDMAQAPPDAGGTPSPSYLRSGDAPRAADAPAASTRRAFSLTATSDGDDDGERNVWSTALERGFEAPHGCQVMLDTLEVRAGDGGAAPSGFEVLLHPPSQFMKRAAVESSAWNRDCALSLLMGLAVHPKVKTVEAGRTVEPASLDLGEVPGVPGVQARRHALGLGTASARRVPQSEGPPPGQRELENSNDSALLLGSDPDLVRHGFSNDFSLISRVEGSTNPQWITQSGVIDSRPFFDVGLDGTGQVVAVADGGLDRDNCYFRDSSPSKQIFGQDGWDFGQRKIVHYDDSFGDRVEKSQGHGTYVSGIIAGKKSSDGRNEELGHADGTAPGSALAFFDMANGYAGIADPGTDRLLRSLYRPVGDGDGKGEGRGARVITASWGRSYYGQYTSFCRQYDNALHARYPDLTLVVSAGNTGRAGPGSIQDPADCKSPLAVGSTLSHGTDLRDGELGIEYLADYSSRGPTQDKRMKPDILAPGHFVLASRANPDDGGECDGPDRPDVKRGSTGGGDGIRYTTGTSMAAPALAGAAAILRQYFEEGYCPSDDGMCCGARGCGAGFDPSGSLVKAVLMNGAQPLTGGVQFVPGGEVLADQPLREYDSNQGMGRVNLLESVPLQGRTAMQMMKVNDKLIEDGGQDVYTVFVDTSGRCKRNLSATLAWYDPPGAIGCTSCLVNDLDLSVKTIHGTVHPNGRRNADTKNTVERVQVSVKNGGEVRVIVKARNFADEGQRYSLVITGCFSGNEPQQPPSTATATTATQSATSPSKSASTSRSSCPSNREFQLTLNTADNGNQLSWNLLGSLAGNGIETVASGPKNSGTKYKNNKRYVVDECLDPLRRYRFQLRSTSGGAISGQYSLMYGGQVIFNTEWSSGQLGKVSTFRFKTDADGSYHPLGSNAFVPHVQTSEEALLSNSAAVDLGVLSSAYDDYSDVGVKAAVLTQHTYDDLATVGEESKQPVPLKYNVANSESVKEVGGANEALDLSSTESVNAAPFEVEDHLEVVGEALEHMPADHVGQNVDEEDMNALKDADVQQKEVVRDINTGEPIYSSKQMLPAKEDDDDHLEVVGDVFEHNPISVVEYDREDMKMKERKQGGEAADGDIR